MVEGLQLAIPGLPASLFQALITRLPIKQGGFGLRSQVDTIPYAYYGALEQSIPHLASVCPQHAHLYGQDLGEGRIWEPLLNSLSRTGQELAACLAKAKQEASALALYLGEEVPLYHSLEATGAGKGRTDGSTRHEMVKEIKRLRARALTKFLEKHPDQEARPVLVRKNCDKTSTAFLLARPGPHTGICPVYLAEHLLALMAVPSGLCRGREGEKIGTLKVDIWGDNVMNCIVPGNDFIRGHDNMKNTLKSLFSYCGILAEVEPYGVFADVVPQQALNRVHGHRASQAIIPDLRVELPSEEGGTKTSYLEVKTVRGRKWYQPANEREVKRRDIAIEKEYVKNAEKADLKHYTVAKGHISRRLNEIQPILACSFGRWGESLDPVHKLVGIMAKERVKNQELTYSRGEKDEKCHLAQEVTYIRRRVSAAMVNSFGHRLVSRMSQVGRGGLAATGRRREWSREEERARLDREASWMEAVSGQVIIRRGRFWI